MKRVPFVRGVLAAGFAIALASPLFAQEFNRPMRAGPMAMSPVAFLIEQADSLALTPEQMSTFREARDSLEAANAPHVEALREARAGGGGAGTMEQLRPVMQSIRANNDLWLEKALTALEPGQREVADRLLARRPRRGGGGSRPD
jgi:hypothetical protein